MNNTCYLVKNLFNYDIIYPPPSNLSSNIDSVYVTDNSNSYHEALNKGWKYVYIVTEFLDKNDSFSKRLAIAYINCYPEKLIPELNRYNYIFICDANFINLPSNYNDFLSNKSIKYALYINSGYYKNDQNNIKEELYRSIHNSRWSYNFKQMIISTNEYLKLLNSINLDYKTIPVISAKYIGWNINHNNKNYIADYVYNEYSKHLQGNIIFSMCLALFKENIFHFDILNNDTNTLEHTQNY